MSAAPKRWLLACVWLACAGLPLAARGAEPIADDAREHQRALEKRRGPVTAQALLRALQATRAEGERAQRTAHPALARLQGNAWVSLGPTGSLTDDYSAGRVTTQAGRVQSIVPHPTNPDVLYIATAGGGVWRTSDATSPGPHWEPLTDNLGSLATGALAMDPASPEILYLGLGDAFYQLEPGITWSRDAGATWAAPQPLTATYTIGGRAVSSTALSVRDLKVDPNDSAHVLAAADVGLFQSTNAGLSWSQVSLPDANGASSPYEIWSIAWTGGTGWLVAGALPVTNQTASLYPGNLGLWRSTDGGATFAWNNAALPTQTNLGRASIAVAPSTIGEPDTARVYLLTSSADQSKDEQRDVFRSDDGGKTFASFAINSDRAPRNPVNGNTQSPLFSQLNLDILNTQGVYNQAIAVDPRDPDTLFIGGQLTHARSKDGGATWSLMTHGYPSVPTVLPYVHVDYHAMAITTTGSQAVLWLGNDGGLSRSTDAFTAADNHAHYDDSVNRGIVTLEPYSVACAAPTWPAALQGYVIGGTQDNGTRARQGNSTLFDDLIGGDGTGVAVSVDTATGADGSPIPAAILGGPFHTITRSTNGVDFALFEAGLANEPPEIVPYAADVAAPDPQTFLTVTDAPDSAVYRSSGGQAWASIVGTVHAADGTTRTVLTPPNSILTLRAVSAYAKQTGVYGAVSNRFAYVTHDAGLNWYVSNGVAQGAQAPTGVFGLSDLAFDPSDATFATFYVGSRAYVLPEGGSVPDAVGHLYRTSDRGLTWRSVLGSAGAALPNVPVTAVLVDANDATGQTVYVGTRSGLYRTIDGGQHFAPIGTGLPLAEVSGLCLAADSSNLKASLWGRGFWQLEIGAAGNPAGVRGRGDLNHDLRLDGFDLIDLVATLGATQADDRYRAEADLVGAVNQIDDADLAAFLAAFGGAP